MCHVPRMGAGMMRLISLVWGPVRIGSLWQDSCMVYRGASLHRCQVLHPAELNICVWHICTVYARGTKSKFDALCRTLKNVVHMFLTAVYMS